MAIAASIVLVIGAGADAMREVPPAQCMPGARDYTFMWWAHGCPTRPAPEPKILCIQTGRYGLAIDVERVRLLNFGPIPDAEPADVAVTQDQNVISRLPSQELALAILVDGRRYTCVRGATNQKDRLNFPARIVESGRFCQRADILQLEFEDRQGTRLAADARLEIIAWPDQLTLILEVVPQVDLDAAQLVMRLGQEAAETSETAWQAGQPRTVRVLLCPGASAPAQGPPSPEVSARDLTSDDEPVTVSYEERLDCHYVSLPTQRWNVAEEPDHLDRVQIAVENPADEERTVRLVLMRGTPLPGITGMSPMLRDRGGNPTGIQVQLSKNWHRQQDRSFLYEGPWFRGFTMLHMPPRATTELEFTMAYARWGGVPAAAHAQLSLIGWGTNQLWDEVAIGSWGESICYEPDGCQRRCMIDDIRPLMVWAKDRPRTKWTWTNNVGGGDFLVYYNEAGEYQRLSRMRTHYRAHGPCLTDVTYAGVTLDGKIAVRMSVSTPRCDDINRAFHRFRYDVLQRAPFTRLAFYQLGADDYNWHQNRRMARGNDKGLAEEWQPEFGGAVYDRTGMKCTGAVPWLSMHEAVSRDTEGGAWANRGFIVRSWRARLGGKDVASPFASVYRTQGRSKFAAANIELSPPPDLQALEPGDFVEAELELVIMPMAADDYYGPNENLTAALGTGGNTWRPVHREAVGNDLKLRALRGEILHAYPIKVRVDGDQSAELDVTGGIGFVPVTFTGLDDYRGYQLSLATGGQPEPIDQSVHGSDYWQTDYDPTAGTWAITYNVSLDTPNDDPRKVRLMFGKK
ncbi:MAG: hypothetical protein ACE5JM_00625 [Armatimonadota bacterium]